MAEQTTLTLLLWWLLKLIVGGVISSIVFIFVALFGVGHLLPRVWIYLEGAWWRRKLGDSRASRAVIGLEEKDFFASIRQKEFDDSQPRPLAVIMVLWHRPRRYPRLAHELKRRVEGVRAEVFMSAVRSLNKGWRSGTPPKILEEYIKIIEASEGDENITLKDMLRGLCSVAMVKYALGDLDEGYRLGKRNWEAADPLHGNDKAEVKWMASYAYFNSRMFQGYFEEAMINLAEQWSDFYAPLDSDAKKMLKERMAEKITLNPVLIIPRHIILAAAFKDGPFKDQPLPIEESRCWPSKAAYERTNPQLGDLDREIAWVEAWYAEAQSICADDLISLNFSHAYAGFYFTLLLHEDEVRGTERETALLARIKDAFSSIGDNAPIVSQYVKYGFSGVYHFVRGDNQQALDSLRRASESSAISGNRFAECIFIFCHAVAAARLMRSQRYMYWEPEVDYYIEKGRKLAADIGGDFYPALSDAAYSAVLKLRGGKESEAARYAEKSKSANAGKRILRMFLEAHKECGSA